MARVWVFPWVIQNGYDQVRVWCPDLDTVSKLYLSPTVDRYAWVSTEEPQGLQRYVFYSFFSTFNLLTISSAITTMTQQQQGDDNDDKLEGKWPGGWTPSAPTYYLKPIASISANNGDEDKKFPLLLPACHHLTNTGWRINWRVDVVCKVFNMAKAKTDTVATAGREMRTRSPHPLPPASPQAATPCEHAQTHQLTRGRCSWGIGMPWNDNENNGSMGVAHAPISTSDVTPVPHYLARVTAMSIDVRLAHTRCVESPGHHRYMSTHGLPPYPPSFGYSVHLLSQWVWVLWVWVQCPEFGPAVYPCHALSLTLLLVFALSSVGLCNPDII